MGKLTIAVLCVAMSLATTNACSSSDKEKATLEDINAQRYLETMRIENLSELYEGLTELREIFGEYERYLLLPSLAKTALSINKLALARTHAEEALDLSNMYRDDWSAGNAIHDGNMVLGLLELKSGNVNAAKKYLLTAGGTPGSPQLNSFGPSMKLADVLLKAGEKEAVIEYLSKCKIFWSMEDGRLDS